MMGLGRRQILVLVMLKMGGDDVDDDDDDDDDEDDDDDDGDGDGDGDDDDVNDDDDDDDDYDGDGDDDEDDHDDDDGVMMMMVVVVAGMMVMMAMMVMMVVMMVVMMMMMVVKVMVTMMVMMVVVVVVRNDGDGEDGGGDFETSDRPHLHGVELVDTRPEVRGVPPKGDLKRSQKLVHPSQQRLRTENQTSVSTKVLNSTQPFRIRSRRLGCASNEDWDGWKTTRGRGGEGRGGEEKPSPSPSLPNHSGATLAFEVIRTSYASGRDISVQKFGNAYIQYQRKYTNGAGSSNECSSRTMYSFLFHGQSRIFGDRFSCVLFETCRDWVLFIAHAVRTSTMILRTAGLLCVL